MRLGARIIATAAILAVQTGTATPASAGRDSATRSEIRHSLTVSFNKMAKSRLGGKVGMTVMPCAKQGQRYRDRQRFGTWTNGPAWSTYKVPLSLWAHSFVPGVWTDRLVRRAIRDSDEDAARSLRIMLGGQPQASARYTKQLRRFWPKSPALPSHLNGFGPANWSLNYQAAFMAGMSQATGQATSRVLREMGQISPEQSWGLGVLKSGNKNVYFKGGWAEHGFNGWASRSPGGLSRQMGVIVSNTGRCWAVAIASDNPRGVEAANRDLTLMANWLRYRLNQFEYGKAPKRGPLW